MLKRLYLNKFQSVRLNLSFEMENKRGNYANPAGWLRHIPFIGFLLFVKYPFTSWKSVSALKSCLPAASSSPHLSQLFCWKCYNLL